MLILLCFQTPTRALKIRPPLGYKNDARVGSRLVDTAPKDRELDGSEGGNKPQMMETLLAEVERFVKKEIMSYFTGAEVQGQKISFKVIIGETMLFSYTVTEVKDEEIDGQAVNISFNNNVLSSNVTLERANLKDYVKVYLRLFLHNYFFKLKQVVFRNDDVVAEVGAMLRFVCHGERSDWVDEEADQQKDEERLLKVDSRGLRTELRAKAGSRGFDPDDVNGPQFALPFMKAVRVLPLELGKVQYGPKDPAAIDRILAGKVISPLPGPTVSAQPGRKLLSADNPRYISPKRRFFSTEELISRQFLEFGLAE